MLNVLAILDGWGIAPAHSTNAIATARTPFMDRLTEEFSVTQLQASGQAVGLLNNQDGNSEAGHMNLGAGRIIEQEVTYINHQISTGRFFKNPAFVEAVHHAKRHNAKLHLMGMLTDRMSAHAYPDHLEALLEFCKHKGVRPYLHLFTDGRDAPPHAAVELLKQLQDEFLDGESIATIMGRYYAMERNKRWHITEQAYNALVLGEGEVAASAEEAVTRSYNRNETDEFIKPHIINPQGLIAENDSVIFFNLRSDRARQISKAFVQYDFQQRNPGAFHRKKTLQHIKFISMTDFGPDLDGIISAFPALDIPDTLPIALSSMRQLYIAESEKYAHITYFFNGGYDHPLNGEQWEKIASPDDSDYTKHPGMSAQQITDRVTTAIKQNEFDFFAMNYANADMLGHSGNLEATIKGIELLDQQIGRLWNAVRERNGILYITADHGNAEEMRNVDTKEIDTEHSTSPVPFIITQPNIKLEAGGGLANVAPTMLKLMNISQPKNMTADPLC